MARHGGSQHFLRWDVTSKTSVLQPTGGYNPVADAQAVAAEFVTYPGLAGPRATRHRLGAPGPLASKWAAFKAKVRANLIANGIIRQGGALPAVAVNAVRTVDVSPRSPSPYPGAIPTQSGWMPAPETPAGVVPTVHRAGDPPTAGAVATAITMDPAGAAFPATFWADVIGQGLNPLIAARAQSDVLRRWFRSKADRAQGGWPPPAVGWP